MDKKRAKQLQQTETLSPEEILARAQKARWRFRSAIRFVIRNLYWLEDVEDQTLGEDIQKNILLLTRKKEKKSLLSLQDKAILNKPAEYRTEEEKLHLSRIIGGLKCFRRYPAHVKSQLAGVTYFFYYGPGRTVVRQGDESYSLYFVITGEVTVSQEVFDPVLNEMVKQDIAIMGPGSMFGEVALLHDIPRTATITTNTHVELLCLKKNDFDIILKSSVKQQWEEVQYAMSSFSYFEDWDEIAIRECCILSKMKAYATDQTILGDGVGLREYVYFVLKGKCRVIEHLMVTKEVKNGKTHYRLYSPADGTSDYGAESSKGTAYKKSKSSVLSLTSSRLQTVLERGQDDDDFEEEEEKEIQELREMRRFSAVSRAEITKEETKKPENISIHESISSRPDKKASVMTTTPTIMNLSHKLAPKVSQSNVPDNVEIHFMQVCFLNPTACFGIGENMNRRRIVAMTFTECLLIPRYWLIQKNKGNIWNRVKQFLDNHIPSTKDVFKEFINQRQWLTHRKNMVKDILSRRKLNNDNTSANVPYFIRINEEINFD